jgi:drug/metabolite transporter (DMT)-like permease
MMSRRELHGVLAAGLSSLLGGTAVVATRSVIAGIDPGSLGLARYGIGSLCLFILLGKRATRPERRDMIPIALLGMLFFAAFPWLFNKSLAWTTAAHGSLALSTLPLLTLAAAGAMGVERLTFLKLAGVIVALLGVASALGDKLAAAELEAAWRGDLVMVGAAFCGAFYNVLARPYLRCYPPLVFTAYAMLSGAAALAALTAVDGSPDRLLALGTTGWLAVVYLGGVGAALTFWLWSFGLERTTPTRVAITVTLNPLTAMTLGTLLRGEPFTPRLLLGLGAIVTGIVLANWPRRRSSTAPETP